MIPVAFVVACASNAPDGSDDATTSGDGGGSDSATPSPPATTESTTTQGGADTTTGGPSSSSSDADGSSGSAETDDAGSTSDGDSDAVLDDFERESLGPDWAVIFPPPPNDQVAIIDGSDLGMLPGPQGFFLVNYRGETFGPDQFCEATIPLDVVGDWAHQVYVRWRPRDGARYGFGYDNDPGQEFFGSWYFKYDGVPSAQTRVFATAPGVLPQPGDVLRVEVEGLSLRGYHNGRLVLEATDTDPSQILDGEPGLAARWATGNQSTAQTAKVWEDWAGGTLD